MCDEDVAGDGGGSVDQKRGGGGGDAMVGDALPSAAAAPSPRSSLSPSSPSFSLLKGPVH